MSGVKNLRKRTIQMSYNESEDTPEKKQKTELIESRTEIVNDSVPSKPPIVAPNGKVFYPCQYCSKIFPHKTTSIKHMKKCPGKSVSPVANKEVEKTEASVNNNNSIKHSIENGELNSSGSSTETKSSEPKIMISQNITVNTPASEPTSKQTLNTSVYDYDEEDDIPTDKDSKENDEDAANNRLCKHCKTLFDSPLDLLRHTRDCHYFPRTILPPVEVEKYFDSPNRDFCPICEKPIKTRNFRSVFIKHLLVHTTGLTHECSVCKKKFRRRDHMRAHEKRHIVSV